MLNIVVLAGGPLFSDVDGGSYPVCLADFDGVPLIERIISRFSELNACGLSVAVRNEDALRFNLGDVVSLLYPGARLTKFRGQTGGAACTAMLACADVAPDSELLIQNATDLVDVDLAVVLKEFRDKGLDGGTIVFPSVHPRYSYLKVDEAGTVVEAAEKRPISRNASAGIFWFRRAEDFILGAQEMLRKNAHEGGIYYVCPVFNELILRNKKIGIYPIPARQYHPFKAERHLRDYENALEAKFNP